MQELHSEGSDAMLELEQLLLHADHRQDPAQLERLLAPELVEVAANGRHSARADVLQWLLAKDPGQRWLLTEGHVERLAPGWRLLRYHARRSEPPSASQGAWHVSLWRYDPDCRSWRLHFHQSTRVA
ncbi:MAG: DUF4440 domain-containing protein [Pseudohongiellaceae bacterium]|jgi:hypothetical protein